MAFDYIKEDELFEKFSDAKTFMLPLFTPLDEYERIARNKPHPGIAKNLPKVTDGTLAALIQDQPKRIIQQIPTGKVKSESEWMDIIASWVLEKEIIPNANGTASLIQKCWAMVSKSLTYGSQPVFVQFVNRGEYFGTDFTLPYIKDVLLEPGKLSDRDSNVIFLRTWWSPNQIDAVIAKENMLTGNSKKRGDAQPYQSGWNIENLKKAKATLGEKDANAMTPTERDKQLSKGFIEIVHVFQRGVGAQFYSFCPTLGEKDNIVRTRVNKDPRGAIPIHYMYSNIDLSNPLGRGSVEMSGGMQNLLDSEVQAYQFMRALLMNPPIEKRGNFSKSTMKYEPAAIWDLGMDQNAIARPVNLSTDSLTSFPVNSQMMRSTILNLNAGGGDTSVGAEAVGPQSSKTPAGVRTADARLGMSDNYMRKQFESTWEEIMETAINLYFAERSGTQLITLDDDTAEKLNRVAPGTVNEKMQIQVDYDKETEALKLEVDASTSNMKDDAAERDRLVELLDLSSKYPQLGQLMGEQGTKELINRIIVKSGVEDPEKIMPSGVDPQTGQPIQQQPQSQITPDMVQQMIAQALQQDKAQDPANNPTIQLMNAMKIKLTDLPEDAQHQVLQQIGLTSSQPTTTAQELAIKASDAGVRVAGLQHQANVADAQAMQADQSHQLAVKGQEQSAQDMTEDQGMSETNQEDIRMDAPELTPQDHALAIELQKRGYTDQQIGETLAKMKHGGLNG